MNYPPEMIGVGKYTGELAAFLQAQGHRIDVVTAVPHYPGFSALGQSPWRYHRSDENGIRVTRCPLVLRRGGLGIWRLVAPLTFAVTAAPVLLYRVLRTRPDVVLCVEPTLFAAPVALLASWLVGAGTVLHVQDLEVDAAFATARLQGRRMRQIAEACEQTLLGKFAAVITISNAMADRLADKGVAWDRLCVVRNWVRVGDERSPGRPNPYREQLGIAPDERVLLYAGSLGAKQGIPTLLAALQHLSRDPGLRVVVAGNGPMKPLVVEAARTIPNMTVLDLQPAERLPDLLAMADTHVLPQDGLAADLVFPSKLGPMLATRRPVVVTANAGTELARWLEGAASVVPAGEPARLAAALRTALAGAAAIDPAKVDGLVKALDAGTLLPAFGAILHRVALHGVAGPAEADPTPGWILPAPAEPLASLPG